MTPAIVFENLTAALRLGERMLNACETVEQFNELLKKSDRPSLDDVNFWRDQEFGRAKHQIESGEGLGKDFIKHFLGDRKGTGNSVVQTVIDSYYAESRKAAAERPFRWPQRGWRHHWVYARRAYNTPVPARERKEKPV